MKRKWMVLSTAVAVLMFGETVFAGVTLEDYRQLGGGYTSWIYGTDLLQYSEDYSTYSVTDVDGNVLSDRVYKSISSSYAAPYLICEKENGTFNDKGVCDLSCNEIVPCEYADINVLNRHWIVAITAAESTAENYDENFYLYDDSFNTIYALIEDVDIYYADLQGACTKVGTLPRSNYLSATPKGNYIVIEDRATGKYTLYDSTFTSQGEVENTYSVNVVTDEVQIFSSNWMYGVKDADGNVIVEPIYDYIDDFYNGYAPVESNDLWGVIDKEGNLVIPCEYERIEYSYDFPSNEESGSFSYGYNAFGYYAIRKNDKIGYINSDNVVTCEPTLPSDNLSNHGCSSSYTAMDGASHILSADGVDTDVSQYASVDCLSCSAGMLYTTRDDNYNSGLIDWHGVEIIPIGDASLELSGSGQYLINGGKIQKVTYNTDDAIEPGSVPVGQETELADDSRIDIEAPAATSEIGTILTNILSLAESDLAGNKTAIKVLLQTAADTADDASLKVLIGEAQNLLGEEEVDFESFSSLINSAKMIAG